jgi:hypothetical protein
MNYLQKKKMAMMNSVASGGRLPSEYQEVEWIGTVGDGQEYIVLEQRHNFVQYDDFIIGVETTTTTADQGFCGVSGYAEAYFTNGKFTVWSRYSSSQSGIPIQPYTKYDIEWYTNTNSSSTSPLLLFAYSPNRYFFTGKIYYFQWLRDNQLLLDLVPCYRKSDNEIGMYDLVNDTFYTNASSGTFTKGNDV